MSSERSASGPAGAAGGRRAERPPVALTSAQLELESKQTQSDKATAEQEDTSNELATAENELAEKTAAGSANQQSAAEELKTNEDTLSHIEEVVGVFQSAPNAAPVLSMVEMLQAQTQENVVNLKTYLARLEKVNQFPAETARVRIKVLNGNH